MKEAGKYPYLLQRLVRTISKDPNNGQDEETFVTGDYYWCRVDINAGRRQRDYGDNQTGADVTVYVRIYPLLSAQDRLTDGSTVIVIESIRKGENEWICEGNYYDDLEV